jgi:serine/threonine-protein kinase
MADVEGTADDRARERAKSRVGTTVDGRYRIDSVLALGGMGAVYLARHLKLRKRVALKLLHPDVEQKVELVLRFEREALAGAHVDNKHVAAATDFGELEDGTRYLVTEYVRGKTLREVLIAQAPFDPIRAARIARQIAVGLGEIHAKGIVHRDLKPRNVMLTDADFVKIIDFGLAKIEESRVSTISEAVEEGDRITARGVIFGTIDYLAPEAAFGMELIDGRADLYALGVIFYEMLTGKHPFDAKTDGELFAQQRMKPPPRFEVRAPSITVAPELERVVMKLLEKDFDERYESAAALIAALDAACPEAKVAPEEPALSMGPNSVPPPPSATAASLRPPAASDPPPSSTPPRESEREVSRAPASTTKRDTVTGLPKTLPWWGWVVGAGVVAGSIYLFLLWREGAAYRDVPEPALRQTTPTSERHPTESTATASLPSAASAAERASANASSQAEAPATSASPSASADVAPAPAEDPAALRAALKAPLSEGKLDAAADAGLALLRGDPHALEDKEGADLIRELLVVLARERHEKADEVWRAAATTQGERGPDMLYRILEAKGRQGWAMRATDLLRDPEVQKIASPALRIAFELRDDDCPKKLELLDRAADEGDERAATALDIVVRGCLKNAKSVDDALYKLRRRLDAAKAAKAP